MGSVVCNSKVHRIKNKTSPLEKASGKDSIKFGKTTSTNTENMNSPPFDGIGQNSTRKLSNYSNHNVAIINEEKSLYQSSVNKICKNNITYLEDEVFFQYFGNCENNIRNGYRELKLINGNIIKGIFNDGKITTGKITFWNGDEYTGQIKDYYMHGFGKLLHFNGDYYSGHFSENLKEGFGIYYFSNGILYQGGFQNDLIHGRGILKKKGSNSIIEADFLLGQIIDNNLKTENLDLTNTTLENIGRSFTKGSFHMEIN
jgi:hypothetical protein